MAVQQDMPRWAEELGQQAWDKINELLYEGWQPAAVRRALDIPASKKRSLEQYAKKFRHRRVIAPVSRLREVLAGGVSELGPKCVKLLNLMIEQALTDEGKLQRTAQVLGEFVDRVQQMAEQAEEVEERCKHEEDTKSIQDPAEAFRQLLRDRGVLVDRDRGNG